jgi:hypothetical protein
VAIIIGALAIIVLFAIVGAVLLLRGGGRERAVQPVPPPAVAADESKSEPLAAMPLNGSLAVPAAPEAANTVPTESPAPQPEAAAEESIPEHTLPIERDTEQHVVLNGQFHELVDQLRALHEQSVEIEQRLNALNKMVERIDQREATKNN